MPRGQQDALLKVTRALPNGAANVTSDSIDLGHNTTGEFTSNCDCIVTAPALATGVLGDAATVKYELVSSPNSDLSGATSHGIFLTQTGAGGAGADAATASVGIPRTVGRYIGLKITKSGAGDATGSTATMALAF